MRRQIVSSPAGLQASLDRPAYCLGETVRGVVTISGVPDSYAHAGRVDLVWPVHLDSERFEGTAYAPTAWWSLQGANLFTPGQPDVGGEHRFELELPSEGPVSVDHPPGVPEAKRAWHLVATLFSEEQWSRLDPKLETIPARGGAFRVQHLVPFAAYPSAEAFPRWRPLQRSSRRRTTRCTPRRGWDLR